MEGKKIRGGSERVVKELLLRLRGGREGVSERVVKEILLGLRGGRGEVRRWVSQDQEWMAWVGGKQRLRRMLPNSLLFGFLSYS